MTLDSYISLSPTVTHVRSPQTVLQTKMTDKTDKNYKKMTDGDMTKTAV